MAAEVKFDQCVKSLIGVGKDRHLFLFPYSGRMTRNIVNSMAIRLHLHMRDNGFPNSALEDAHTWLSHTSTAARAKNVVITYRNGAVDVRGEDINGQMWLHDGLETSRVVVLSSDTKGKKGRKRQQ